MAEEHFKIDPLVETPLKASIKYIEKKTINADSERVEM